MKLAMIDNDKAFMTVMSLRLSDDFQIETFHDPCVALKELNPKAVDGVLLDLHMGEIDGFEVCQAIRKNKPDLPVFFLTSDTSIKHISRGFSLGGVDYFPKSMAPEEIICRIKGRIESLPPEILKCREIEINLKSRTVIFHHPVKALF